MPLTMSSGWGWSRACPCCLNPDRVSVQPDGTFALCPGTFAARYEAMGGSVRGANPVPGSTRLHSRGRRAGVGDLRSGIHSGDIAGGHAAGLDTLYAQGIHWPNVADDLLDPPDPERLAALCRREGRTPA